MPTQPEARSETQTGTVRVMTRWSDDAMHRECAPVTDFDDALHALVDDMYATMAAADGVGLAANQVGVDLKVFVFDCPDADGERHSGAICNPVLELPTGDARKLDEALEGCLSLPGAYSELARPDFATVRGQDPHGEPITYSGTGMLARCLQHETDHLHGTVFGDRLTRKARKALFAEAEDLADRYPDDWPVSPKRPHTVDEDDAED